MDIQLLQRLGNIDQIAGIREVQCTRGPEAGLHMLEIYNAAGLCFTVMPGRCLDIYDFSYKGYNFAFHSKNGLSCERNPAEDAFFHQWPGGMLSTCGLANVGDACEDGGVHPIHGRIGSTPARHVSVSEGWEGTDYILRVGAEFWETRLYGRQLSLLRTISASLYGKNIVITDTITNHAVADEEFMLLYHINFGYPLLDASSFVLCPPSAVQPRNDHSEDWVHMCAPGAQAGHQMFLHTPQEENGPRGYHQSRGRPGRVYRVRDTASPLFGRMEAYGPARLRRRA